VQCGQVAGLDGSHPALEVGATAGGEQVGEGAGVLDQDGERCAAGQQFIEVAALVFGQLRGPAHDPPHEAPRRRGSSRRCWCWCGSAPRATLLRHGGMAGLFGDVRAPSTLGTFLRLFT
jgi:hypothetical protein